MRVAARVLVTCRGEAEIDIAINHMCSQLPMAMLKHAWQDGIGNIPVPGLQAVIMRLEAALQPPAI